MYISAGLTSSETEKVTMNSIRTGEVGVLAALRSLVPQKEEKKKLKWYIWTY
jgi:hypothetical protein